MSHLPLLSSYFNQYNLQLDFFLTPIILTLFSKIYNNEDYVFFLNQFIARGWPFFYGIIIAYFKF